MWIKQNSDQQHIKNVSCKLLLNCILLKYNLDKVVYKLWFFIDFFSLEKKTAVALVCKILSE